MIVANGPSSSSPSRWWRGIFVFVMVGIPIFNSRFPACRASIEGDNDQNILVDAVPEEPRLWDDHGIVEETNVRSNIPEHTNPLDDSSSPNAVVATGDSDGPAGRMSIANMTCHFFRQPLNHFVPRGRSPTYEERYCVYYGYAQRSNNNTGAAADDTSPIFFYTGNESPLEQYINQTGLMWELAPKLGARIVFAEHRYEGHSLPPRNLSADCLSYASTFQALADYARLLEEKVNPHRMAPVVVFGGSYGGMLSAWMRMKYPHLVAGAIAASAPIGAFPQSANSKIDSSARVLTYGLNKPYPPTATQDTKRETKTSRERKRRRLQGPKASALPLEESTESETNGEWIADDDKNHCSDNLLAAWPLIAWLANQGDEVSSDLLQKSFSMCDPLPDNDAGPLLRWAQGVWFDLAEGSFPYPSSYIPFALLHKKVDLPPWPIQDACWKSSQLHKDWGVRFHFHGSKEDVNYTIDYGDSKLSLDVNWDSVELAANQKNTMVSPSLAIKNSGDLAGLLTSVKDAVSIWYNITKDVPCYNISQAAPNSFKMKNIRKKTTLPISLSPASVSSNSVMDGTTDSFDSLIQTKRIDSGNYPAKLCRKAMYEQGSWGMLCCNDEMNLVITDARGMGHDFFWPPSHPRNVRTYQDMIRNATFEPCPDPFGIYGYSKEPYEPLSIRLDTYYGGIRMKGHSNIVFSNGLLDPWSAGGVYKDSKNDPTNLWQDSLGEDRVTIQNITETDVIALIIPFGGHHTDLMYSSKSDPKCVTEGRKIEEDFIARWIREW